jgi:hypothetical protein
MSDDAVCVKCGKALGRDYSVNGRVLVCVDPDCPRYLLHTATLKNTVVPG